MAPLEVGPAKLDDSQSQSKKKEVPAILMIWFTIQ